MFFFVSYAFCVPPHGSLIRDTTLKRTLMKRNEKGGSLYPLQKKRAYCFLVLLRKTRLVRGAAAPLFVSFDEGSFKGKIFLFFFPYPFFLKRISLTGLLYAQLGLLKSEIRATKSIGRATTSSLNRIF